ncbi:MAG: hypothetical protein JSW27_10595 [Phycisphaerales bacterium]|nr:MAG: hypothetical protein JSW27_10595 [Phycisphaerales bacterium]
MEEFRGKRGFVCDMDGVIYHGSRLLEGPKACADWLKAEDKQFLFLANSSARSPRELHQKLRPMGVEVGENQFISSAMATAHLIASLRPGGRVVAIGDSGLYQALYEAGLSVDESDPDYVVVGETRSYSYEKTETAVQNRFGPQRHHPRGGSGALRLPAPSPSQRRRQHLSRPAVFLGM